MKHRGEIWAIAFPAIVTNITTPILGLVDVAVTGHIGAALYIGAIAVGGAMFNMLYWLFNFLRMGTTGFTAQAFGAEDNERLNLILYRSLIVGLVIGLLMLALSGPLALPSCDSWMRPTTPKNSPDVILRFAYGALRQCL